jgi:hypothetical protein
LLSFCLQEVLYESEVINELLLPAAAAVSTAFHLIRSQYVVYESEVIDEWLEEQIPLPPLLL